MFLAPPAYLATLQNNIRQRPIPWDGAVRSGIITDDQLTRIRAVDRAKKPDTKQSIVEDDINAYTSLFAGDAGRPSVLESAAKQPPMLQYILVLLGDLIGCRSHIYASGAVIWGWARLAARRMLLSLASHVILLYLVITADQADSRRSLRFRQCPLRKDPPRFERSLPEFTPASQSLEYA